MIDPLPDGCTITTAYKPGKLDCIKMEDGICTSCECNWDCHVIAQEMYIETNETEVINVVKEKYAKDLGELF